MDTQFEWREEFNIGVESIDKEHRQLFKIINKIFALNAEEKNGQWACQEGIKFFKGHALKHFADEEEYMASIHYEGLERHQLIHKGFRENTLPALEHELVQSDFSEDAVDHFLGVCAGWLIGHTLTEDLSITGKSLRKWEKLLPGEDLQAMRKVIVELMFNMFHLESQMISDTYRGERFGKGIYYRLIFETKDETKKQEVLLVWEERLLVSTVGKIIGLKSGKLDSMLLHAARYTARQFAERALKQLHPHESYELKAEKLLSYEQFQRVFDQKDMQASLLFNTGEGYFAYCVTAPHLLEDGDTVGTLIEEDKALEEVEKYLKAQAKKSAKKKILLVDDSATIRQMIETLLDKDYEITLVESGISAIRTITLNRPDLILLDYEMPVCDGRQTLEMLRSEKNFADIPVIFLTGRSDPESVKKVMSLNPEGYLLKYLKPEEIKQKIDAFFTQKETPDTK